MKSFDKWRNKQLYRQIQEDFQSPAVPTFPRDIGNGQEDIRHSCAPSSQCGSIVRKDQPSIPPQEFWPTTPIRKPSDGLGERGNSDIAYDTFNTQPVRAGGTPTLSQGMPVGMLEPQMQRAPQPAPQPMPIRRESFKEYVERRRRIEEIAVPNQNPQGMMGNQAVNPLSQAMRGGEDEDPEINQAVQNLITKLDQRLANKPGSAKVSALQSIMQSIIPQLSGGYLNNAKRTMTQTARKMTPNNVNQMNQPQIAV